MQPPSHIQPASISNTVKVLFSVFFWMFNAILLLIVYLGYLPFLAPAILADAAAGQVPINLLIPFVGLVGVPTSCTVVGIRQRRSLSQFQIFFGVEAPFLMLCLARFFWLRDLNPVSSLILLTGALATFAFTHWLFSNRHAETPEANWWHLIGLTAGMIVAAYLLTVALFYVPPMLFLGLRFSPIVVVYAVVMMPITILLAGFFSMPFGIALVFYRALRQSLIQLAQRYDWWRAGAVSATVLVVWVGLFIMLQQQPQNRAFELLETPPQTDRDRQELLKKSNLIRDGLLNAYLAPYRYPRQDGKDIYYFYQDTLQVPEAIANDIQFAYDFVTSPFTYSGEPLDQAKAADLYARFFDKPILRGEKPAIEKAIQSTFNRTEAKAGLLDVNAETVLLTEQQISVKPQGDWAEIELYEVYQNQTFNQQEILYFFSLPESAVVTGLWLGATGDRSQSFPFAIATRGAAQQVYNQEVNRRVDPALLEQVGPRNYRLRAFPIPPKASGEMHLWMTYKVLQQDAGWALPQLHERRNVYWTKETKRFVDGKAIAPTQDWMPASLPAKAAAPTLHQVTLPGGTQLQAAPFQQDYQLPQNQRFALILDTSYSMNAHRPKVTGTFEWLTQNILPQNTVDLYLTATDAGSVARQNAIQQLDADKFTFYGTLQPREMLQQFQQLRQDAAYDAILLLTDEGSYELTEDSDAVLQMPAPLWFVHLGGLQPAYDDATQQAIQDSGGSVSTQIQEVMQRIGTQPRLGQGLVNLVDGYAWSIDESQTRPATVDGLNPLAARQWVIHLSRRVKPSDLRELDAIHAIAKQQNIVTPYSSMIVLVNEQQKQDLAQAERNGDRFKREVEDQQLPQPSTNGNLTAVPEPAEWLLLGIGAIGLWFVYRRQRQLNTTLESQID